MKLSLVLFTIFFPAILHSQNIEATFNKKCSIGISFSPDVVGRTIFVNKDENGFNEIAKGYKDLDKPTLAYSGGVLLNYKITNHFSIESGLMFSNKGFALKKMKMDDLNYGDMIDPRYGYVYQTQSNSDFASLKSIRFVYNYYYLDVPFRICYTTGQSRLKFVGGVGITANFLLASKRSVIYNYKNGDRSKNTRNQPENFTNFNLSPNISAGVDYELNSQFNVKVIPTFSYGLIKIIDAPLSSRLWSAGLNCSLNYRFQ